MKTIFASMLCLLAFATIAASGAFVAEKRLVITLRSQRTVGQTDRAMVLMDVGGEFKERAAGRKGKGSQSR